MRMTAGATDRNRKIFLLRLRIFGYDGPKMQWNHTFTENTGKTEAEYYRMYGDKLVLTGLQVQKLIKLLISIIYTRRAATRYIQAVLYFLMTSKEILFRRITRGTT